jgi:hypothetical protein
MSQETLERLERLRKQQRSSSWRAVCLKRGMHCSEGRVGALGETRPGLLPYPEAPAL